MLAPVSLLAQTSACASKQIIIYIFYSHAKFLFLLSETILFTFTNNASDAQCHLVKKIINIFTSSSRATE